MKEIDINTWNRKEHYEFFSSLQIPYFGITSTVKITEGYKIAKEKQTSLFAYYLHKSLLAANQIKEFKYRVIDGVLYELDQIGAGATAARKDETFAFIFAPFNPDYTLFKEGLDREIEEVHNSTGLRLNNDNKRFDLIRYTTLPWVRFTNIQHPINFNPADTVPRIVFGKIYKEKDELYLPISIDVHHGIMDGLHVAKYLELFEELLNKP